MILLYPHFLWLIFPLIVLLFQHKKKSLTPTVHLVILALILFALSRPVLRAELQEQAVEAKDIIIALDISYSMRAKDIAPSRYIFAKKTIEALLDINPKDNIMLIAFTTNPLLLSPATTDHALIKVALKSLNPEYILTKGTSLAALLKRVASLKVAQKNLILITDGGEERQTDKLASQIENTGINLTLLALGTQQGTTIEKTDGTLLKDKNNHLVISRINPAMETLTSLVNGSYLTPSHSPEATAKALQISIEKFTQQSTWSKRKQYRQREFYQIPLLLALLLFFMLHTRAVKYLMVLFTLFSTQAQASLWDGYHLMQAYEKYQAGDFNHTKRELQKITVSSLQSQYALANTYYRLRKYTQAIAVYQSIRSTSTTIKQRLYYNIANAYTMLHTYDKAKFYYTKALQLGAHSDAKHNLALIALLKKEEQAALGIAHPKSQNSGTSKSDIKTKKEKQTREEDQPSSGGGSGGETNKKRQKLQKQKLLLDPSKTQHPLSSKVYELINKGYIHEQKPW